MIKTSQLYLFLLVGVVVIPLAFLFGGSFIEGSIKDQESWQFIKNDMLGALIIDTLALAISTVVLSTFMGVLQAVMICLTDIKCKQLFHMLFVLPLIFPLYVLSFVYVGSFEYSGMIPSFVREVLSIDLMKYISIKSTLGIAVVFSFALTPYVYLFSRSALMRVEKNIIYSAKSLGKGPHEILFKLLIPQIKPWVLSASILVFLEVLCDFGGVSVFNYDTFSTAIYHAWVSLFSLNTAVKLSVLPTIVAILLFVFNNKFQQPISNKSSSSESVVLFKLSNSQKMSLCLVLLFLSFFSVLFPIGQLLIWSIQGFSAEVNSDYFLLVTDSFFMSFLVSLFVVFTTLVLSFLSRNYYSKIQRFIIVFAKVGYAVPGSIIAIAIMNIFSLLEFNFFGVTAFVALFWGFLMRFFSVSFEIQNKAYEAISKKMDWTSYSLGKSKYITFLKVHLPILRPVLISSAVMIFIEVIKEMPLTLILRPYGVNTLATKIYELTSEGEWERAAISGSLLILLGAISIFISESYQHRVGSNK